MIISELYKLYSACDYRVSTDSRSIEGGEIFFALKGENFDGNKYALSALEKGAAWAVVDSIVGSDPRLILVEDSFKALQELAVFHRNHLNIPVIGLTGTNGKTTTKNLISAVLATKFKVYATAGNLNNDIGVPLTLLSIRPDCEIAVVEMGANHPDDIAKLVKVAQPDYGLITNVGKAHLLGFGSFEGVKAAKGELYRYLGSRQGSLIFINEDDADLRSMVNGIASHFYGYGREYQGVKILNDGAYLNLEIGGRILKTQLVGSYNCSNVLAALAVGEYFGVDRNSAFEAIEGFEANNKRSQMLKTQRNTVIVDAYNANPSSMACALDNFAAMKWSGAKLALLGDMRELGDDSLNEHIAIVRKLMDYGLDAMLVGSEFEAACRELGVIFPCYRSSEALAEALFDIEDALVLVKGSRSICMEKTLESL